MHDESEAIKELGQFVEYIIEDESEGREHDEGEHEPKLDQTEAVQVHVKVPDGE